MALLVLAGILHASYNALYKKSLDKGFQHRPLIPQTPNPEQGLLKLEVHK